MKSAQHTSFSLFESYLHILVGIWILAIPLKNSIYQVSTVLLIITFLSHLFITKRTAFTKSLFVANRYLFAAFFAFILSMLYSSATGIHTEHGITDIVKYIYRYPLVLFAFLYFFHVRKLSKSIILFMIILSLTLQALNGVYQYVYGLDLIVGHSADNGMYLKGALYHHNPFGLLMAIGASLSLVCLLERGHASNWRGKALFALLLLLFLFDLFHSQSRSAWVMFGLFFVGYTAWHIKRYGFTLRVAFIYVALTAVGVVVFLSDAHLQHRLMLLLQGDSSGRTTQIWPYTWEKIKASWLTGYGVDSFKVLFRGTVTGIHAGVHNMILELLLYTGIIGTAIMIYLFYLSFKTAWRYNNVVAGLLLASYFVLLQFDGSLIDGKIHLNVFVLLLFFIFSNRPIQLSPDTKAV